MILRSQSFKAYTKKKAMFTNILKVLKKSEMKERQKLGLYSI